MSKLLQYIIATIIAVAVGFFALREHDASVRAQALAQAHADSLQIASQQRELLDIKRAQADSAARDSIASLTKRAALNSLRTQTLSRRADSLERLTLGALTSQKAPDTSAIRQVLAVKDSNIAVLTLSVSDLQNALSLSNARWWVADSAASAWRRIAINAQTQLRAAIKRSAPRFACVGGVGLSAGLGGSAGGLTVACGYRF